jgi:integrase
MAVFQRGKVWYCSWYEKIGGELIQKKKALGEKKSDAVAYHGKIMAARKEGRLFDMKKEYTHTFDELLSKYEEAMQGQRYFKTKKYHLEVYRKCFSGMRLADITRYLLEKFKNERKALPVQSGVEKMKEGYMQRVKDAKPKRERSNASVNRELSTLRHIFSKAKEWEMMERSPFEKARALFLKENNKRLRFLSVEEADSLLSYCEGVVYWIVKTALSTGMRRGELLSLKWSDIRNGFIYLTQTKTDMPRQIPLNETLKEIFSSIPRHITSEYVFCNREGKPFSYVARSFNTALGKSGIRDFHFHDLRHTFASWLVMKGASLKEVQELLGHRDIEMTMRYSHLSEDHKKKAMQLLDGELKGQMNESKPKVSPGEICDAKKAV